MRRPRLVVALAILAFHTADVWLLGRQGIGPLLSNILELAIGCVALFIVVGAARRSGHYGRQVWLLTAASVLIWTFSQALITYLESNAHWPFSIPWPSDAPVFVWPFPLLACLFVDEETAAPGFDWILAVDFGQVLVLALALHQWMLSTPSLWQAAPGSMTALSRDTRNLRDGVILLVLLLRAFLTRRALVRQLFFYLAGFVALYGFADVVYHYGEDMWGLTTGSRLDVLWVLPFVFLAYVSAGWNRFDEESELRPEEAQRMARQILTICATLLPIPVVLLSMQLQKEQPRAALLFATAALLLSAVRMWLVQVRQTRFERLQQALYRISETSRSAPDLQALFRSIHQILADLMYAKNCYIAVYDPASGLVSFPYFVDEIDHDSPSPRPRGGTRGITEYVLRTGKPLLATPPVLEELEQRGEVIRIGAPSLDWVGVPLQTGDSTFGVLALQSYETHVRYGRSELKILTFVSQQIASAITFKRNAEAIRESESNFRALAENASAAIYIFDEKNLLYVNPGAIELCDYPANELLAMNPLQLVHPEDRQRVRERLRRRIANQEVEDRIEFRIVTRSGKVRWVDSGGSALSFRGKPARIGVAVDTTDRKLMEDQLRQAVKMEAVGRLAGGIAHDFNNLLTIISGYSQLQMEITTPDSEMYQHADQIKGAADRAAALTRQLLAFSRQQVLQPQIVDLNEIITAFNRMMPRLIGEDVQLEVHLGAELGAVKVDPGQIDQVLLNLVVNARDAMPHGGKILIETANVELDHGYAATHPYVAVGDYVSIAVSDTGQGIDPMTRAHIFEPFFTTKAQGKGTGLGLSTVYGIVKQSGGSVEVYSEPGSGTTFMIYFPRVSSEVTTAPKPEKKPEQANETILLVEDDNQLRELARTILSTQGYRVLMPERPEEAPELCAGHNGVIDLLLTDVVMPNVNGIEIAGQVKKLRPGIKVLYMSGYTSNAIVEHGVLAKGLAYLQKPFSPFTLAEKIREVLNGH